MFHLIFAAQFPMLAYCLCKLQTFFPWNFIPFDVTSSSYPGLQIYLDVHLACNWNFLEYQTKHETDKHDGFNNSLRLQPSKIETQFSLSQMLVFGAYCWNVQFKSCTRKLLSYKVAICYTFRILFFHVTSNKNESSICFACRAELLCMHSMHWVIIYTNRRHIESPTSWLNINDLWFCVI